MPICERTVGDVCVLEVDGRMMAESSDRVVKIVRERLREGRRKFLINLERVQYIDTTGLADLVESMTAVKRMGGALKLTLVTRHVHELLRITGLVKVFEMFDVESEAIASFGG
ncbi:MAG TPA: STAS domain-containing protein [Vicinamibacterales bacterium]|nr:STAS domain-containing protein [Vicinamibacterales bacterium]